MGEDTLQVSEGEKRCNYKAVSSLDLEVLFFSLLRQYNSVLSRVGSSTWLA